MSKKQGENTEKRMEIVYKGVGDLIPYEKNPRNNEQAVDKVANSIREFGFKVPIVVDKYNVVVCGHTRLKAAKKLGLAEVPCVYADDLTDQQIKAYRIADNKVSELASWDDELLTQELEEITDFDMSEFGEFGDLENADNSDKEQHQKLSDKFIVPPFDILDAKQGDWTKRKRIWKDLIGDYGQARKDANANKVPESLKNYGEFDSFFKTGGVSILDPVLAEIICSWFLPSDKDNATFDCFSGDTVFGYVSSFLGNRFTGIELRQEQVDFNTERTSGLNCKYICDDGRNVLNHIAEQTQDLLFSCPPYFDLEVYSDLENDASNQKNYSDFLDILKVAFSESLKCLKENRFAVIVVGDIRDKRNGDYYNFPNDIVKIFKENGCILYNNIKLLTPIGANAIRASSYMRHRKTVHIYQDVLVFFKGDAKKIKDIFPPVECKDFDNESANVQLEEMD